jgi:hypothetical protein
MTARKIIGDPELINEIMSSLSSSDTSDEKSIKYIDKQTGETWMKYDVTSMYIEGQMTNLIKLPEPTSTELIDIVFSSEYNDEVIAASLRLRDNELCNGQEFREQLLNELVKINIGDLDEGQKTRIQTIIILSELAHGENRREIIGKTSKDIKADSDFFMNIAVKADEILATLE